MKYVSIDIETTGMNPDKNQMIQFGAVIEDTENQLPVDKLPTFEALLLHDSYAIDPFCLDFHKNLYAKMGDKHGVDFEKEGDSFVINASKYPKELEGQFKAFLEDNGINPDKKVIVAGKNFTGFDAKWINPAMPSVRFHHRVLDPMSLFVKHDDKEPPNLSLCAKRANLDFKAGGYHTAISDAIMVVELLRKGWK